MKKKIKKDHKFLFAVFIAAILAFCTINIYINKTYKPNYSEATILEGTELWGIHPHVTAKDTSPIEIPDQVHKRGHVVKLPILMYHHIGLVPNNINDPLRKGLTVSPEDFEAQVKWVFTQGYKSISLNDLYLYSKSQKSLPKKPVIFTFDDGYEDAFTNAVPILQKYGFTGTFGIITGFAGSQSGTNTYATWDTITAAQNNGMEIVCHTENHFDGSNPKYSKDYILNNFNNCQKSIITHLGNLKPYLIYPYGHYTDMYLEQVRNAGFVMGLTVHEGSNINLENLMQVPRVRVSGGEALEDFKKHLLR